MRYTVLIIMALAGIFSAKASSDRYLQLADSADYYISIESWDLAESKIIEALRLEPANFSNSLLLSNLGIVRNNKGEYDKAIEAFSLGLSIAPSSTVLLNNRARTYLLTEQSEKAREDLETSLGVDSIQEWPIQSLAFLQLQNGDLDKSENLFYKLTEYYPDNPMGFYGKGIILQNQGKISDAEINLKKALELSPDDEEILCSYVLLLIGLEKYSEARSFLRKAIEKNPENGMFYLLRGYISRLNYLTEEAKADKKIAIDKGINPEYVKKFIPL